MTRKPGPSAGADEEVRTSRPDWLEAALRILVEAGVPAVKVLTLARRLSGSRSSFYWFFESREALLDALIEVWKQRNTGALVERAERPAPSVSQAFKDWRSGLG